DHPKPDPLETALAAWRRMPVPDRPADDDLLAQLRAARESPIHPSAVPFRSLRRFLMRPTIRYLAAAAVLFALFGWLVLTSSNSVALADVIQATAKHKLVRYKLKQICDDKENGSAEGHSTVYVDLKSPRLRIESRGLTFNGVLEFVS